jgi:hypothetical protein
MRKGSSDAHIAASGASAIHNIRRFIESQEFADGPIGKEAWSAALQIAADLTILCRQHASDRRSGVRFW